VNNTWCAAPAPLQVIVGNASWRFGSYLSYCRNGSELDEMPLYMFDKVRHNHTSTASFASNSWTAPVQFLCISCANLSGVCTRPLSHLATLACVSLCYQVWLQLTCPPSFPSARTPNAGSKCLAPLRVVPPPCLQAFASACPHLVGDYRVPAVFSEDLFEVLGEDRRPDYRCGREGAEGGGGAAGGGANE
jgi:hypothetical protein